MISRCYANNGASTDCRKSVHRTLPLGPERKVSSDHFGRVALTQWPGNRLKGLSALLRRKMPQLTGLGVEPGIPVIKRPRLPRKRAPKIRLSFRDYTPTVGAFIERYAAGYLPGFVSQIRYLRVHSGRPHQERPTYTLGSSLIPQSFRRIPRLP